ncbi:disulfide bond formation protein B [Paenibacillus sp. sptzw28]|uniref:disulfide oxidoreductase n=1 Tax=Paenibacillus sp. sptzw28 TaxID=715179 RepID=UPI001C6F0EF2|nr:disulfide oxidoreductase [Paenibacillus sp. sptzw28]QYR19104.1 disulfide bond formation protein B [Paenibacillus sp. sptzw28]
MLVWVRTYFLYLAWVVSMIATGGSLFLSEIMNFEPCKLCWLQRIFMYPLVILLGRASYLNDRKIIGYALPLSILGGCISLWHYLEQKVPGFADIMPCSAGVPCDRDYLDWFGVITIPFMALIAFILITVFLLIGRKQPIETDSDTETE